MVTNRTGRGYLDDALWYHWYGNYKMAAYYLQKAAENIEETKDGGLCQCLNGGCSCTS